MCMNYEQTLINSMMQLGVPFYYARLQWYEKRLLGFSYLSVCPSA